MGNLVGVVAAISAGGAGAVFWMWVIALVGSSTAFIEATLAQLYKEKDPLYGGYRGGPAYYIHSFMNERRAKRKGNAAREQEVGPCSFICHFRPDLLVRHQPGDQQFHFFIVLKMHSMCRPIYSTIVLVVIAAVIVLRKNATVKVLDIMVPIMAACYFFITLFIIVKNAGQLPDVFGRIFAEAFGFRQIVAGGIGAVIMNGAKRDSFPMRQVPDPRPVRQRQRISAIRQKKTPAGAGGIYRYAAYLHLFGHDHAADAGRP